MNDDPFALLGLPPQADLSDDDARAAWRRIAAATHPDRDDGGDPARFAAAAAAYSTLRTGFGRGEALADLTADGGGATRRHSGAGQHGPVRQRGAVRQASALAVRAAVAAAVAGLAFLVVGLTPSSIGVLAGVLTWLLVAAGRALARGAER